MKTTVRKAKYSSIYIFNHLTQRYELVCITADNDTKSVLISALNKEYMTLYEIKGKGKASYHKYIHPQIDQI